MDSDKIKKCIFDCEKTEGLILVSKVRLKTIISSSEKREDEKFTDWEPRLEDPHLELYTHRSCVSTYTSKTHIERALRKKRGGDNSHIEPVPMGRNLRHSDSFNFQEHCLLCGDKCKDLDPKNPGRYNEYFIIRTLEIKNLFIETCRKRQDGWSEDVRKRISYAPADLCAVEARYHSKCLSLFVSHRNISAAVNKEKTTAKDLALEQLAKEMSEDPSRIWNTVSLHSHYVLYGGHLGKKTLLQKLQTHFGEELVILSASGFSNIVLFRKYCPISLVKVEKEDNLLEDSIKILANAIRTENIEFNKSNYYLRINKESVKKNVAKRF